MSTLSRVWPSWERDSALREPPQQVSMQASAQLGYCGMSYCYCGVTVSPAGGHEDAQGVVVVRKPVRHKKK